MDRTQSLREFQQSLADKLRNAQPGQLASRLAVQAGGGRYLLRLDESGEVLAVPEVTPVPLTRAWFLGLANVRGELVCVVDLAAFLGEGATHLTPSSRLVLVSPRLGAHCGLLVDRLHGLKNMAGLEPRSDGKDGAPRPWMRAAYDQKSDGEEHGGGAAGGWRELDLAALVADEEFLQAGA